MRWPGWLACCEPLWGLIIGGGTRSSAVGPRDTTPKRARTGGKAADLPINLRTPPQVVPGIPRIPQDPRLLIKNGPRIPNLRPRKPLKPTRQDSAHTQWLKLEYLHKSDTGRNYLRYILPGKLGGFFHAGPRDGTVLYCNAECCVPHCGVNCAHAH